MLERWTIRMFGCVTGTQGLVDLAEIEGEGFWLHVWSAVIEGEDAHDKRVITCLRECGSSEGLFQASPWPCPISPSEPRGLEDGIVLPLGASRFEAARVRVVVCRA
jgi:hypothetical protein